jgi:flagellar protein FliO/FliZ
MTKASLLPRAVALCAAVVLVPAAPARAASSAARGERTPVDLAGASSHPTHIGGSGSIVRTIVGLAIVIGVIYGVAWVLRQVKSGREGRATGAGLASLASVPLGSGRSVQLVRAGREFVLVGVAEHGVTPLRTYTELEAHAAGLIDDEGTVILGIEADDEPRRPRLALPRPRARLALPAPKPVAAGNVLDTLRAWTVRS